MKIPTDRIKGKTEAAKSPALICPLKAAATALTTDGPAEQPRSPATAKKANIAVVPFGQNLAQRLKMMYNLK